MGLPAVRLDEPARGAGRTRAAHVRLVSAQKRPLQAAPATAGAARNRKKTAGKPRVAAPSATGRKNARVAAPAANARKKPRALPADVASRSLFQLVCIALGVLTVLGLVRVTLSAQAAEASIDQLQLERSIKAESRLSDKLELDKSLLVTPSRIESAAAVMQMTKAPAVQYLSVSPAAPAAAARPSADIAVTEIASAVSHDAFEGMLAVAMEVTRKEARTLLVGDAAVAAAR